MKHNAFWYRKNHLGVLIALIFFGLAACQDESDCTTDSTNIVLLEFIKLVNAGSNNEADEIDSVIVIAEGTNAGIPFGATSQIGLPLNPLENSTTFYIFRQEEEGVFTSDTLVITYQREQTLISPECGPDQQFIGLGYDSDRTTFDSLRLRVSETSQSSASANFQIYTCRYEMSNVLQLRFNYPANEDTIVDTLVVSRVYSDVGKQEDLSVNDSIPENGSLTVSVPIDEERDQIQVFLEIDQDDVPVREVNVLYRRDTFQVPTCLAQNRYQVDSVWMTDTTRLFAPEITEELLNINNPTNAQVSIR
ncbi:DUF6452 family protein [Tunicatimonas pelagia]|uniref:DUF6452 family protein n=1 Tax=Tunicatimonas pelagia TaxID=931531 RepID=UPI002666E0E1|nr:DUF6452 family protein [Tunicatimonas pelagia]WKN41606.1 DUF6452 family protein [Tunicatimonas pelagia]